LVSMVPLEEHWEMHSVRHLTALDRSIWAKSVVLPLEGVLEASLEAT
jgi:hypothetical protein